MPAIATAAIIALSVTTAAALGWGALERTGAKRADEDHAEQVAELQADKQQLSEDLGTCRARVTQESIDATGRVVAQAQAADIADTQLRAAVVEAIPAAMMAEAVIATGSPQSIAAYAGLIQCAGVAATGDSARLGCGPSGAMVTTWAASVEALAACPEPGPTVALQPESEQEGP